MFKMWWPIYPLLTRTLCTAAALALLTSLAGAQAAAEQTQPRKEGWNSEINAAFNLARGNSKTLLLNGGLVSEYKKSANEFRLEINGAYGESSVTSSDSLNSTEQTTIQNAKGIVDYKRLFSERDYGYANGQLMHDHIAGIDYRLIAGPGLGRYFLKSERQSLNTEAGVAYVRQELTDDTTDNTLNLRAAQRYELKLLIASKLWESVEYLPVCNDFGNYFVNFEIGAEAPITGILNLRIVFLDQYNSQPAQGKDNNDLQLTAGIGCKI